MDKLKDMRDFFYGFNYKNFFGDSDTKRLKVIADGVEHSLFMLNSFTMLLKLYHIAQNELSLYSFRSQLHQRHSIEEQK